MKKTLFILLVFIGISISYSSSQNHYFEEDVEVLKNLLRQNPNLFERIGMMPHDTLSWDQNQNWVHTWFGNETWMLPHPICKWVSPEEKEDFYRLSEIDFEAFYDCIAGTVDFGTLDELERLNIRNQSITELNLLNCSKLKYINCEGNQLTSFDMSGRWLLEELHCGSNQITSIDIRSRSNLRVLSCGNNLITEILIQNNSYLEELRCANNQITSLDLSGMTSLQVLDCYKNQITTLNTSNMRYLRELNCSVNQISSLNIQNNVNLTELYCTNNQLTSLYLFYNINLEKLVFYGNQISAISLNRAPKLKYISCQLNGLTSLNVSNNPELEYLACEMNELTSLDLSRNPKLYYLECHFNKLTSLDISNKPDLSDVNCHANWLTSLKVENCPKLYRLWCQSNYRYNTSTLDSLDVSTCPALKYLNCSGNGLVYLDLTKNSNLVEVNLSGNKLMYSTIKLRYTNNASTPKIYFYSQETVKIEVEEGDMINMNAEFVLPLNYYNGITRFSWWLGNERITLPPASGLGQFIADPQYAGQTLRCLVDNPRFYMNGGYYWEVKINKKVSTLQDHLTIVDLPTPNSYSMPNNTAFQVYLNASNMEKVSGIALFNQAGSFIQDISTDRNGYVFSCLIPITITGNYVLSAYTIEDGVETPLVRPENSIFIDKLPLNITRNYGTRSIESSDIGIQQHMQIKTSANYLHFVNTNETFKVLANSTLAADVSIGLFSLDGSFVEDITASRANNTFTCMVSDFVWDDNYIIIPYETSSNGNKLVERVSGTQYIDRLPVYVEQDIWGDWSFAAFQPNGNEVRNVSSIESLHESVDNLQDDIQSIEIYSISGVIIKSVSKPESLSSVTLPKGTYVAKVKTTNEIHSFKFSNK